ncbi:MAG: signal peptidase I [Christensenellaceae bacterium]|jgi:signal peptidase I|nr:signal peptidase I [Christensenellaceae bacterium]
MKKDIIVSQLDNHDVSGKTESSNETIEVASTSTVAELKKKKISRIINIATNVLLGIILAMVLVFAIMSISKTKKGYNSLFGYTFLSVASDSMAGNKENSFNAGDLIVAKIIDGKEEKQHNLKIGDVITFWDLLDNGQNEKVKTLNTHRVVGIFEGPQSGQNAYATQGDNIIAQDPTYRPQSDVVGIYSGKIKGAGKALDYLQSKDGFLIFVLVPAGIAVIYCLYVFIANLLAFMRAKTIEQMSGVNTSSAVIDEAEKEKIKLELLREMGVDPSILKMKLKANEVTDEKQESADVTSSPDDKIESA